MYYISLIIILSLRAETTAVSAGVSAIVAHQRDQTRFCQELSPGESQIINQSRTESNSGLSKRYKLTRDVANPNRYIAEFNLRFLPTNQAIDERYSNIVPSPSDLSHKNTPDHTRRDEMTAAMIARTRQCFQEMQSRLRTADGRFVELRLSAHNDPNPPPQVEIGLAPIAERSSSSNWARRVDCATIVHEVMHLMGLCDGYREQLLRVEPSLFQPLGDGNDSTKIPSKDRSPQVYRYNCRSEEPMDSIMNNQNAVLGRRYEGIRCPHTEQSTRPPSTQVESLPLTCPDGTPGEQFIMSQAWFLSQVNDRNRSKAFYFRIAPTPPQTLYPAQMRMITQPLCNESNQTYIDCAQNAYRTQQIEGCANVPDQCRNRDFLN